MNSTETTLGHPITHHHLVIAIGVRVMNIVVNTSLEAEASRLPELGYIVSVVIVIEDELRHQGNQIQSHEVSLSTSQESTVVSLLGSRALVLDNLLHSVESASIWVNSIWKRPHGMKSSPDSIERHTQHHGSANTDCGSQQSVQENWTKEVVRVLLHPVVSS